MKLHYAGYQPEASGFGWATCSHNLVSELAKLCELRRDWVNTDVVFQPIADHNFNPVSPVRGKVNLGYSFFEFPLGPNAAVNAAKYDTLFVGSTWCLERLKEAGIQNGKVLIQGVDQAIFSPQPPRKPDGQFRIFSGGKFEYRKGQDLVIAAFKEFSCTHDDAHLVCSWFNPWPQLIRTMNHSDFIQQHCEILDGPMADQFATFGTLLEFCGLNDPRFTILRSLDQKTLAAEMANTDVGLFPNRCEGGTNLVLMEYASVGRKVVANVLTGHWDIRDAIWFPLKSTEDSNHWAVTEVKDIIEGLERAYRNRGVPPELDEEWLSQINRTTWKRAAETIYTEALACLARK